MWFSWWFEELTAAAAARIREEVGSRDGGWGPAWRLLHGLTSIGSPALASTVGDTADSAQPERVETAERLVCLVHCDSGEDILKGTESRTVLDNWFRARRRIHDLADALRKRGMPLPAARSLRRYGQPPETSGEATSRAEQRSILST